MSLFLYASMKEFEVINMSSIPSRTYTLDLERKICDYRMWQLFGICCQHAVCSILHLNISSFEEFVDKRLRISTYMKTYAEMIHPVPKKRSWPKDYQDKLEPPYKHAKPDRLKKVRRRDPIEERKRKHVSTLRFSLCHKLRHNKRSCKQNPDNASKKKEKVILLLNYYLSYSVFYN